MAAAVKQVNAHAETMGSQAALFMNINAAKGLHEVMKTNLGPRGTIKMLVGGAGGESSNRKKERKKEETLENSVLLFLLHSYEHFLPLEERDRHQIFEKVISRDGNALKDTHKLTREKKKKKLKRSPSRIKRERERRRRSLKTLYPTSLSLSLSFKLFSFLRKRKRRLI